MYKLVQTRLTGFLMRINEMKPCTFTLFSRDNLQSVESFFSSGTVMDSLLTSSEGAVAGPACAAVVKRVSHGQSSRPLLPLSVIMSRCLALARFALGSSQRANSRLIACARGLSSRTVSRPVTGGKLCLLACRVSLSSCDVTATRSQSCELCCSKTLHLPACSVTPGPAVWV